MKKYKLEPLEALDIRKCNTVGDIILGMSRCSFGARMLGEVALTLADLARSGEKPFLIYDGKLDTPLALLLEQMAMRGWFYKPMLPETYTKSQKSGGTAVIIGPYSERYADALYRKPQRTIFINEEGYAKPSQIRDGHFPDAIFADPRYVMPVINCALAEWLEKERYSASELICNLKKYDGLSAEIAQGANTLFAMIEDPECAVIMTLSGAMTVAKMGLVVCDMIDDGYVQLIVSTGALMAHGLVESVGLKHFKYCPNHNDTFLAEKKLNRVTDTLEPESNLDHVEGILSDVLATFDGASPISPALLNWVVGKHLLTHYPNKRGILASAYRKNVPVIVPAFVDSELGNDVYLHNMRRVLGRKDRVIFDLGIDTITLLDMATRAKYLGIFSIGGGVPRNFAQNVAPLVEILNDRLGQCLPEVKYFYGCRIAPDRMWYGHLSGCTYSEGISWRKMDPHGQFAEIHTDATLVWPFLVKFVVERVKVSDI